MSFYSGIATYYDVLFPYDDEEIFFLRRILANVKDSHSKDFLDVGCATGAVLSAVSGQFRKLIGLDLNPDLLKIAGEKLYPSQIKKIELLEENMMNLGMLFPSESFGGITCLGNTLPHLTDQAAIESFFSQVNKALSEGGVFIFQTINYNRILDSDIRGLPIIEREGITFERYYSAVKKDGLIVFDVILSDAAKDLDIRESISLRPYKKEDFERCLRSAGFSRMEFFGDYAGSSYGAESPLLIGACYS
jgi:glycine/sarcosine N-methyltransferase